MPAFEKPLRTFLKKAKDGTYSPADRAAQVDEEITEALLRIIDNRIGSRRKAGLVVDWHQRNRITDQVRREANQAHRNGNFGVWLDANDPDRKAQSSGTVTTFKGVVTEPLRGEVGTPTAETMRKEVDSLDPETREAMNQQEQQAQDMMLRVLSWCVIRYGGEIIIPRAVLEDHQYKFASHVDDQDRLHITAEQVGGEEIEQPKSDDGSLPY